MIVHDAYWSEADSTSRDHLTALAMLTDHLYVLLVHIQDFARTEEVLNLVLYRE